MKAVVMRVLDAISDAVAWIAAWSLFVIGLMLGYEVVARYFFNAPTVWAEELSRVFLVWAVFLAAASLLRHDAHIRVTVLTELMSPAARRAARVFAMGIVLAVSATVFWYGLADPINSIERGRTTGTMLDIPAWTLQASVPAGFGLLALQSLAELLRLFLGETYEERGASDHMAN